MISKTFAKKRNASARWIKRPMQMLAAVGLLFGASLMQSCDKDLLTGQPAWLGNSIYERLQDGIETNDGQQRQFTITLKLIDDLGYKETLSRTGSKTVFATPDDVFEQWFKDNNTSYDKLTIEQKKNLFNNAMVNNAYLIELMSNVSGNPPQEGFCLRRETATSIFDNIPKMELESMPVNPMGDEKLDSWAAVRDEKKGIYICKDATTAPMMHFLPAFMKQNNITSEDLKILSNGKSDNIEDSWINGTKVISKEQTCKNGYVYVVDGVIEGTTNMAQKLHELPNTTWWARALDRFSTPVEITDYTTLNTFHKLYNTPDDEKLYTLGYFNSSTNHRRVNNGTLENDINELGVLRIDPGWNQYSVTTGGQDMHFDGAVMIVPTDSVLQDWWDNRGGRDLKDRFGSWDNIDYETLVKILNVNMQESLVGAVPSKFHSVLDNTSQRELGIDKDKIVACYMCCNGVIYLVNDVFAPDDFSSVIYPAQLQTNGYYSVINHAMTGYATGAYSIVNDFSPYISSMDSRFALIIPYNNTVSMNPIVAGKGQVFRMVDPCTFGMTNQNVLEFYYADNKVQGVSYKAKLDSQGGLDVDYNSTTTLTNDVIVNRLYNLIDNNIVVFDTEKGTKGFNSSQLYYQTKTGGMVKAYKEGGVQHIDGGYQIERGETVAIPDECIVDKGEDGNGVTYGVSSAEMLGNRVMDIPMTSSKSVYQLLSEESSRSGNMSATFFKYLGISGLLSATDGAYECAGNKDENYNITLFDSYHYTVYVPVDGKIQALVKSGALPTIEDYDAWYALKSSDNAEIKAEADSMVTAIKNRVSDFIRYHVQDKSVCINGDKYNNESFESGKLNPANNRFYTLTVTANESDLEVKDNLGNVRKVTGNFKNKFACEYWIKNKGKNTATLDATSYVVVHQINDVLLFSNDQLKPCDWKCPYANDASAKRLSKSIRRR